MERTPAARNWSTRLPVVGSMYIGPLPTSEGRFPAGDIIV
jgi:hypothetical protein